MGVPSLVPGQGRGEVGRGLADAQPSVKAQPCRPASEQALGERPLQASVPGPLFPSPLWGQARVEGEGQGACPGCNPGALVMAGGAGHRAPWPGLGGGGSSPGLLWRDWRLGSDSPDRTGQQQRAYEQPATSLNTAHGAPREGLGLIGDKDTESCPRKVVIPLYCDGLCPAKATPSLPQSPPRPGPGTDRHSCGRKASSAVEARAGARTGCGQRLRQDGAWKE